MVSTDVLRQVRLLRGMNQEELEALVAAAGVWECPKGQVIFKEEDDSDTLYIIHSGSATILISTGILIRHTLAHLGPGDVFGELGFIDRKPRTATVRCTEPCLLLSLTREGFRHLADAHPNIERLLYKNLGRIMAERLRHSNEQLKELAGQDRHIAVGLAQHYMV